MHRIGMTHSSEMTLDPYLQLFSGIVENTRSLSKTIRSKKGNPYQTFILYIV